MNFQHNNLFNGFLSLANNGSPTISSDVPENPKIAIQSGPILISGKQITNLNIQDRESARRSVATITNDGKIIFLSLYFSCVFFYYLCIINVFRHISINFLP